MDAASDGGAGKCPVPHGSMARKNRERSTFALSRLALTVTLLVPCVDVTDLFGLLIYCILQFLEPPKQKPFVVLFGHRPLLKPLWR